MKNVLQGWMWLIPTILLSSPAFLLSSSDVIMIPSHVQLSFSNFSIGITLSKLSDEEFVWLRTGRIQNSGKREKFMVANKIYTC